MHIFLVIHCISLAEAGFGPILEKGEISVSGQEWVYRKLIKEELVVPGRI